MQTQARARLDKLQILSFVLDNDFFGMEISNIQEVLEYHKVTPVPRTPDYMLGVINLRGQVVPVIDLRRYFDMQTTDPTVDSCIIIVEMEIEAEKTAIGLLADRVKEVLELNSSDINPPPKLGNKIDNQFIYGVARHDNQFIILLKIHRIFSDNELADIASLEHNGKHEPVSENAADDS
ncbi:MAG TPA: chemotaxis protein CheW [Dongiaceae bacterium]|nr:chemotaxis protein CheW [Dongiaceae bacterium]